MAQSANERLQSVDRSGNLVLYNPGIAIANSGHLYIFSILY